MRPTVIVVVPALYGLFCMMKTLNFKKVRYFAAGGDALSDKIRFLFALFMEEKSVMAMGLLRRLLSWQLKAMIILFQQAPLGSRFIGISSRN